VVVVYTALASMRRDHMETVDGRETPVEAYGAIGVEAARRTLQCALGGDEVGS
jgi:hypothetical protein